MFATCGAHPGTEYRPQWRKMPSLASSYHSGNWWVRTDSQVGWNIRVAPRAVGGANRRAPIAHFSVGARAPLVRHPPVTVVYDSVTVALLAPPIIR